MSMSPEEILAYQTRRNSLNSQYNTQLSQLGARQQYDNIDFGRASTRLTDSWNRNAEDLGAGFARRGMSNSGVYQRGMGNYLNDRSNAFTDTSLQHSRTQDQFASQRSGMGSYYTQGQSQIDAEEAARRSHYATQLTAQA